MKKMIFSALTVLFMTGAVMAQDKKKDKSCCAKDSTAKKACCKQPSKTTNMRLKAAAAKPANKK